MNLHRLIFIKGIYLYINISNFSFFYLKYRMSSVSCVRRPIEDKALGSTISQELYRII